MTTSPEPTEIYDFDTAIATTRKAMQLANPETLEIVQIAEHLERHFRDHFTDEELPLVVRTMLLSTATLGTLARCGAAAAMLNVQAVAAVLLTDYLATEDRR